VTGRTDLENDLNPGTVEAEGDIAGQHQGHQERVQTQSLSRIPSKIFEFSKSDQEWMEHALALAVKAEAGGEVPVGAVVVRNGAMIAEGWNQNISLSDPTAHAEIVALRAAGQAIGNHRMPGCVIYVTLEPCAMCAAAMIHARLDRVVFGAPDPKTGAFGGAYNLPHIHPHNHEVEVAGGLLSDQSSILLREFFKRRR
jgi:tRNA(adenine34) deaminase